MADPRAVYLAQQGRAMMGAALGGGAGGGAGAAGWRGPPPPAAAPAKPKPGSPEYLFAQVDTDKSGAISATELHKALSAGGMDDFDMKTIVLMMNMFDADRSGHIGKTEFVQLWGNLVAWKKTFDQFDRDGSKSISTTELQQALFAMGYRLTPVTFQTLLWTYDSDRSGAIAFDEFIALYCELTMLTNSFARMDVRRTGVITVSYDQFVHMVFGAR